MYYPGVFYPPNSTNNNNTALIATPLWVAVGDYPDPSNSNNRLPLILYSGDLAHWTAAALPAGATGQLHAIRASRDPANSGLTQLVAVGDNGLILTSSLTSSATDSGGLATVTVTSTPAVSWASVSYPAGQTPPTSLYGIAFGAPYFSSDRTRGFSLGFQAVGSAGATLNSY